MMTPTPPPPDALPGLIELSAHIEKMTAALNPALYPVDSPAGRAHRRALEMARSHAHDPREVALRITIPVEVVAVWDAALVALGNPPWASIEYGPGSTEVTLQLRARFTVPLHLIHAAELMLKVREGIADVRHSLDSLDSPQE